MKYSAFKSDKYYENLKVHASINENTRETIEDNQVSNNYVESLKAKKKSKKMIHEEDKQSKKLNKNLVGKYEFIVES